MSHQYLHNVVSVYCSLLALISNEYYERLNCLENHQCRKSQSPNSTLDKIHRDVTTDGVVSNSCHVLYYIYYPSTNLFIVSLSWPHFNLSTINDFLFSIMESTVTFSSRKIIQILFHISTVLFLNDQLPSFTNVSAWEIEPYESKARCINDVH